MQQDSTIIFEDDVLMVLEKPPGLHSVTQSAGADDSVASWLIKHYPELAAVGKINEDAGLVQRLDFETCGLMLVAKSSAVHESLRAQLLEGTIAKIYRCLVEGHMPAHQKVTGYIGSRYRGSSKVQVIGANTSKPPRALSAHTEFSLIKFVDGAKMSLVEASAPTARRHQIRAHAAHLGHPLVGDTLYGSARNLRKHYPVNFFLQASFIEFIHPVASNKLSFSLEIPEQLTDLVR